MFKKIIKKMPCTEKFLQWVLPRGAFVMLALAVGLLFLGYAPRVETGTVEYKIVTGSNEHGPQVLILQTDSVTLFIADEIRDSIQRDTGVFTFDQGLEDEISRFHNDIQYRLSVRLAGTGRANIFYVPRQVFNGIRTNDLVRFEIEKPHSNRINRMINKMAENTLATDSYFPEYSGLRHFMSQ
jgi:hypothetical protein